MLKSFKPFYGRLIAALLATTAAVLQGATYRTIPMRRSRRGFEPGRHPG